MKIEISDLVLFLILARIGSIVSARLVRSPSTGHLYPGTLAFRCSMNVIQSSELLKTGKLVGQAPLPLLFREINSCKIMVWTVKLDIFSSPGTKPENTRLFSGSSNFTFTNLALSWSLHLDTEREFCLVQPGLVHLPQQLEHLQSFLRRMPIRPWPPTGKS